MPTLNKVFGDLPVTIFEAMSQLARDNNAINLGQGFPDDPGPEDIRKAAADASVNGYNQYPSMMGIPELRQAIASHYGHWHEAMVEVGEPAAAAGPQHLRIAELLLADGTDELEALRPFHLDRRNRQEQRARKIALGTDAGLGEGFVGGDVGEVFGQARGGEGIDRNEIDRSGHRRLQPVDRKARHRADAGLARRQPVPIVLLPRAERGNDAHVR